MKREYGIQLYSIRDLASVDLESALSAVSEMGYSYVEFAGFFSHTADEVSAMLNKYGLKNFGAHVKFFDVTESEMDSFIEFHQKIGTKSLVIPAFDGTELTLERMISFLNTWKTKFEDAGITLGYHNHSFEMLPTSYGKTIFNELVERTECELEIDIFWAYNAGIDPVALIEKYHNRIRAIHIKDGIAAKNGEKEIGYSLGLGEVPVYECIRIADKYGILSIVESEGLDPSGKEEVERCMKYLRSID